MRRVDDATMPDEFVISIVLWRQNGETLSKELIIKEEPWMTSASEEDLTAWFEGMCQAFGFEGYDFS